ncbi:dihydroorotate dehydrogenase B (NAD(+)), electron transfer subunit [Lentibacillus kapialis]|uniref:Dihydroorotate dehydrogenase B (NAD(+)), electron transfer subunit n=1 Tax=Lentibacillus kapialis TaxID=340214 RepID=A0A917PNY5_9BACI|nr:dihydroorotate dehydrogenase electron transfer subunit [Lentibacillus kapialis]GGJ86499.1 dihydroorotate dehydrogenase B (NAD(+)), electron transfer subunit [Lentibacillus kapialis]
MKKCTEMIVTSVREIALDIFEMSLANEYIATAAVPGQFLHLFVDGHTLRRPISIAEVARDKGTITILFKRIGDGTKRLASLEAGMSVSAIGPAGNGFTYKTSMSSALLVGGGIGIPPLYCLGKELRHSGIHVKAILGFQTENQVFYEEKFQELGKTYIVTDDGSYGYQGLVTDVLDQSGKFDHYFSCGPIPMLQSVINKLGDQSGTISLEERLGCGIGACFACVIPSDTEGGYRKICSDGPVFAANEVVL